MFAIPFAAWIACVLSDCEPGLLGIQGMSVRTIMVAEFDPENNGLPAEIQGSFIPNESGDYSFNMHNQVKDDPGRVVCGIEFSFDVNEQDEGIFHSFFGFNHETVTLFLNQNFRYKIRLAANCSNAHLEFVVMFRNDSVNLMNGSFIETCYMSGCRGTDLSRENGCEPIGLTQSTDLPFPSISPTEARPDPTLTQTVVLSDPGKPVVPNLPSPTLTQTVVLSDPGKSVVPILPSPTLTQTVVLSDPGKSVIPILPSPTLIRTEVLPDASKSAFQVLPDPTISPTQALSGPSQSSDMHPLSSSSPSAISTKFVSISSSHPSKSEKVQLPADSHLSAVKSDGLSSGVIGGIVGGSVIVVIGVIVLTICLWKQRKFKGSSVSTKGSGIEFVEQSTNLGEQTHSSFPDQHFPETETRSMWFDTEVNPVFEAEHPDESLPVLSLI